LFRALATERPFLFIYQMIRECKKNDTYKILNIINDASIKYKGIIPNDCWKEPYMSEKELLNEFSNGVCMYGYRLNNTLIGVIGIQEVKDVVLIRHAYTLSSYQNKGVGSALIKYLLKKNQGSRLLVGTWKDATWAIQFYKKFDFFIHTKEKKNLLLKKYWQISAKQIENSVVLEK